MTMIDSTPEQRRTDGYSLEPAVELVGVTKHFGKTVALHNIDVSIRKGEFLVLLGPSGCGKSTILKIVSGLEDPTEGDVYINGRLVNYVAPRDRNVAMVFQNYALYPHMTVKRNIGFPLEMGHVPRDEIRRRVKEVASLLEIDELLERYPEQLSGGQRQRVALGRALIRDPIVYLMDEPLSNLDAILRVQMREELQKLHRRIGRTTIYVTHDQVEAMTMAHRIVVLRSGIVQQIGSAQEVYMRPANSFVATFVGSPQMNLHAGVIVEEDGTPSFVGKFKVALGRRFSFRDREASVFLGIRPEHIAIGNVDESGAIRGKVILVEPIGSDIYLSVEVSEGASLKVRAPGSIRIHEDDQVGLSFHLDDIHLFNEEGLRIPALGEQEKVV